MPMDRRRFIRNLAGAGLGAYLGSQARDGLAQQPERRPNILFIMTDQHKLDTIRAYGNPAISTPNMDRLAAEGMRFERYYVAAFPCSPSRASIMTGLHPQSHGVLVNGVKLNENLPTFAGELSKVGYHTSWMGKWHLGGPQRFIPGSEDHLPRLAKMDTRPPGEEMPQNGFQDGVSYGHAYRKYLEGLGLWRPGARGLFSPQNEMLVDGHTRLPGEHWMEGFVTTQAISYLEDHTRADGPFCLGVSYHGPHRPMTPPEPWDKMYDPAAVPLPASIDDPMADAPRSSRDFRWRMRGVNLEQQRDILKRGIVYPNEMWDLLDRPAWTEREFREIIAHYYGYVSYIDAQMGRLLEALDKAGLADNTLVIYTTDHGDFTGAHGCIFKAMMMYDDLMRVPLIVRYPGIAAGSISRALCSSVDLMPTLLDYGGTEVPEGAHGKSMRTVLEGETDEQHEAVCTTFPGPGRQVRMVRTEDYKFSLHTKPREANELYDMKADPLEMHNLAGKPEYADVEQQMRRRVFSFMDRIEDPWRKAVRLTAQMPPLTAILFEFDEEFEQGYWATYRGLSGVEVRDGKLVGHIDCPGYMIARLDEPVQGDDYPALEITMSATAGEAAQLYWATKDRPQMCEPLSLRFPIRSDGKLHTYRLNLAENANWRGKTITSIRLNPLRRKPDPGELSADFAIERIGRRDEKDRQAPRLCTHFADPERSLPGEVGDRPWVCPRLAAWSLCVRCASSARTCPSQLNLEATRQWQWTTRPTWRCRQPP